MKIDESEKETNDDGSWRHTRIVLKSDYDDDSFKPIVLQDLDDGDLTIVVELVEAIGRFPGACPS